MHPALHHAAHARWQQPSALFVGPGQTATSSSDGVAVAKYATELMDMSVGLGNRAPASLGGFGFVSHVSWFSEFFFSSFTVGGRFPRQFETWSSSLFNPYGGLTPPGEAFFANCADAPPPGPMPGPTPPNPHPLPPPPSPTPAPAPVPPPSPPSPSPPDPAPTLICPPASSAQCGASQCAKSAPYECLVGTAHGGCASSATYWHQPDCTSCIDTRACTHQ
eukprot:gene3585-4026_t